MKERLPRVEGVITRKERGHCHVTLDTGQQILAPIGGRLMLNKISCVPGDKVIVEVSPFDNFRRGRIVTRLK